MSPTGDPDRLRALMMKLVDGVATPGEARSLEAEMDAEQRRELEDFLAIKETTDGMTARILADARLEPAREPAATRAALGLGLGLLLASALTLAGFAAWAVFTDAAVPLPVKLAAGAAGAALGLLLLTTLRRRRRSPDPYEEVDR